MIKVDLITGLLGSGKTSFLKEYVKYYMNQGIRIGILENDYGAVNVDMLFLNELRGELCELEMVAGGCDSDCHKRRFKTKLISMAMSGYKRVLIEPSGLFDMDEFFDTLREEPLDNWYEIGSVITVVDVTKSAEELEKQEYMFKTQLGHAMTIVLSKTDLATEQQILEMKKRIEAVSGELHCKRPLGELIVDKSPGGFEQEQWKQIESAGYQTVDYVKKTVEDMGYETIYLLEHGLKEKTIRDACSFLFGDESHGRMERIKGFFLTEEGQWMEVNATRNGIEMKATPVGQEVIILIGTGLDEDRIKEALARLPKLPT